MQSTGKIVNIEVSLALSIGGHLENTVEIKNYSNHKINVGV
jgi:hypothetical protein